MVTRKKKSTYTSKKKKTVKETVNDVTRNVIDLKPKDKEAFGDIQARNYRLKITLADLMVRDAEYQANLLKEKTEIIKALQAVQEEMMSKGRQFALSYGIDISGKEKWNLDLDQMKFYKS